MTDKLCTVLMVETAVRSTTFQSLYFHSSAVGGSVDDIVASPCFDFGFDWGFDETMHRVERIPDRWTGLANEEHGLFPLYERRQWRSGSLSSLFFLWFGLCGLLG